MTYLQLRVGLVVCVSSVVVGGCSSAPRPVPTGTTSGETAVVGTSWNLCTWLGPSQKRTGVFGTDLGFEADLPAASEGSADQVELLFGDTYAQASDACQYPVLEQDDLAVRIPRARPDSLAPGQPRGDENVCDTLQYTLDNASDPTSWRRIHLFPDATDNNPDRALDTGLNRTPLTAWGDGTHAFTLYYRDEFVRCSSNAECPQGASCSQDAVYLHKAIKSCEPHVSLSSDASPAFCRDSSDCSGPAICRDLDRGVCVADVPFQVQRDGQDLSPNWYDNDPRDGIVSVLHVASAFWPDRPEDYASGFRWATQKFINPTARTVAHFDPQHPEQNDYSPGYETLLVWGRPSFVGHDGYQSLPFLLYQPLQNFIADNGQIAWAPHYFAGYDAAGNPQWSEQEADAQPIYGVDENLTKAADGTWSWNGQFPEFDYVNQLSTTYVPQLQRWLMIYGGETPHELDPGKEALPKRTHAQSVPGAVHLRAAVHPWGRARATDAASDGFSQQPKPVLTPTAVAKQLACNEGQAKYGTCNPDLATKHGDVIDAVASAVTDFSFSDVLEASAKCSAGGELIDSQYSDKDQGGHLYGAAIMQSWTQDVTDAVPDLAPGDHAVELYWNVSTWNPYQVLLIKTQLRASDFAPR